MRRQILRSSLLSALEKPEPYLKFRAKNSGFLSTNFVSLLGFLAEKVPA